MSILKNTQALERQILFRLVKIELKSPSPAHFINSMRTISSITEKKIGRNLWLVFLANEINATHRDVTDPTDQVQIMSPLKDKNLN